MEASCLSPSKACPHHVRLSRLTAPSTLSKRQPLHPQASYPYASGSSSPYPYQNSANNATSSYASLSSAGRASPYYDASSRPSSSMGAAHGSSSLPQYSKARTAEDLEEQGDERLAGLMGKVRILKDVSSRTGKLASPRGRAILLAGIRRRHQVQSCWGGCYGEHSWAFVPNRAEG